MTLQAGDKGRCKAEWCRPAREKGITMDETFTKLRSEIIGDMFKRDYSISGECRKRHAESSRDDNWLEFFRSPNSGANYNPKITVYIQEE